MEERSEADHGASVSVVIPAFNAELCLGACLDSVLGQTVLPQEIIVVNDGSEDGTATAARTYGARVLYLEQENQGQGAARNAGLAVATTSYVAFLDADDYWRPRFLERTVRFLDEHPDVVAVSTGSLTRLQDGRERVGPPCVANGTGPNAPLVLDDFYRFWAEEDHVRTGTVLIRRRVMEEAGGQRADLRISQDLEYWGYLATFGKWGFIPEPLWIGNSRAAARRSGWMRRYRERRRLCPSVEAWQARLLPRLTDAQRPHFLKVRGRVAAGYAHARILGGNQRGAWDIVQTYGDELPRNRVTRLMRFGLRTGFVGWHLVCLLLVARERFK